MPKFIYPFYVQTDAINSLFNQLTDAKVQSQKSTKTKGEAVKAAKAVGLVASFLQVLGLEANISRNNETSSDYSDEIVFVMESEHKLKQIREQLRQSGSLYDLNYCLNKNRPFGSFVDFHSICTFTRKHRFIEVKGTILSIDFLTICSPDYVQAKSFLYQALDDAQPLSLAGFGIVVNTDVDSRLIKIKSLMLGLDSQGYHM